MPDEFDSLMSQLMGETPAATRPTSIDERFVDGLLGGFGAVLQAAIAHRAELSAWVRQSRLAASQRDATTVAYTIAAAIGAAAPFVGAVLLQTLTQQGGDHGRTE